MRQNICRALLVLGLLVPLSRSSFGDTFLVSGSLSGSGDLEGAEIMSPSFTFGGARGSGPPSAEILPTEITPLRRFWLER